MTHPIINANICLFSGITNLGSISSEEKRKERKNKSSVITIGHHTFIRISFIYYNSMSN